MRYYKDGKNVIATIGFLDLPELNADEYAVEIEVANKRRVNQAELFEKSRPLTESEVNRMFIARQINTLEVDDNTARRMVEFYPEWAENTAYTVGYKVQYDGKLWRCVLAHTSQVDWQPSDTSNLWEQINETHAGTLDDPIPYSGNMELTKGLYYMQDYAIYRCIRDTVNPVYQPLAELVGVYVCGEEK